MADKFIRKLVDCLSCDGNWMLAMGRWSLRSAVTKPSFISARMLVFWPDDIRTTGYVYGWLSRENKTICVAGIVENDHVRFVYEYNRWTEVWKAQRDDDALKHLKRRHDEINDNVPILKGSTLVGYAYVMTKKPHLFQEIRLVDQEVERGSVLWVHSWEGL